MRKQNIQIFRILACLGVFVVHVGNHISVINVRNYTDYGAFGVQLFFMISAIVCFLQFERKQFVLSVKNYIDYIEHRFIRILPLFYYVILIYFIYYNINGLVPYDNTGLYWWRYVLMIFQLIPSENDFWMNLGGVWSISAFFIFYLFSPVLWKWIHTVKKSVIFLLVFLAFEEVLLKLGFYIPKVVLFQEFFLFGIVVYCVIKEQKENQFILALCGLLLLMGIKRSHLPVSLCYRNYEIIFFSMVCAILIIVTWNYKIEKKLLVKITNMLDAYTYPVYLCHFLVITLLMEYYKELDTWSKTFAYIGLAISGTVIFSFISKNIIDNVLDIFKRNIGID